MKQQPPTMPLTLHLLFWIALLGSLSANALAQQAASLAWSPELKAPPSSTLRQIVDVTKEDFLALRYRAPHSLSGSERYWLERYDHRMRLLRSQAIDLKYKNKVQDFEGVFTLGGKLWLLTSFHNKAKKEVYLFRQQVGRRSLRQNLRTMELVARTPALSLTRTGHFNYFIPPDSSHLLLYNSLPYQKGQPEQFAFRVFRPDFQLRWERDVRLPWPDEQFRVEEYRVDRHGNVYLLGVRFFDGVRERRAGKPNYQYVILAWFDEGRRMEEYALSLDGKFITDLTLRIGRDGIITCAGFFSEKGTWSIKGSCYLRIDPEGWRVLVQRATPFTFEFLAHYLNPRRQEKARQAEARGDRSRQPELYRYALDHLILRTDGGAVLVAEQYYVEEYTLYYTDYYLGYSRNQRRYYYYHYNDIILVNIRPDGSLEWITRIPKRQETLNDRGYFSSYAMATVRDRFYFVFNDHPRNFDERHARRYTFDGTRAVVALAEVRKDGSVRTRPLTSPQEARVMVRPKVCRQIGARHMALYGESGRRYRFGKLRFP